MFVWPYVGLVLALVVFAVYLRRDWQATDGGPRWLDPVWLCAMVGPLYALHQFEEHAIDFQGHHYAFQAMLCHALGFPAVENCPATPAFILAVNVGTVWIDAAIALAVARRHLVIALAVVGIPLVNVFVHLGAAIAQGAYNPGLVSALVLLLPYSAFAIWRAVVTRRLTLRLLPLILASGVLVHLVLAVSVVLAGNGFISQTVLCVIQVANAGVPVAIGLWGERLQARSTQP